MPIARTIVWALMLLGLGWTLGYAQKTRPEPEFMLAIDAPVGETIVECVSGCGLIGAKDLGGGPNGAAKGVQLLLRRSWRPAMQGARCRLDISDPSRPCAVADCVPWTEQQSSGPSRVPYEAPSAIMARSRQL